MLGTASAAPVSAMPGPPALTTGFDADTLLPQVGQPTAWFQRMERLGSSWVRIPVNWSAVAPARRPRGFSPADPADPHYNWFSIDHAVIAAAAARQQILFMLDSAPAWALGRGAPRSAWPGTWRPSATAFGTFARAVAERYSGAFADPSQPGRRLPRVSAFQAWNEPNLPTHLAPQWTRTDRGVQPASPAIYRGMLNAMYTGVKTVQPRAYVLAAGLAPYGDPPGTDRMRPVAFLRSLLCLDAHLRSRPCPADPRFDAIDFHPYSLTPTIHAFNSDDVSVPDAGRLRRVLDAGRAVRHVLPAGPKAIWMTEIDWDSSPPDPLGIPVVRQARYVSLTFYELWHEGVNHVMWYEVPDPGTASKSFTGGGLFLNSGTAKPSATAFGFPFVAVPARHGAMILWGRAPTAGQVTIEVLRRSGWHQLVRLPSGRGGIFYAQRRAEWGLGLRARIGSYVSGRWTRDG